MLLLSSMDFTPDILMKSLQKLLLFYICNNEIKTTTTTLIDIRSKCLTCTSHNFPPLSIEKIKKTMKVPNNYILLYKHPKKNKR